MAKDDDCLGSRPELDELSRSYLAAQLAGDRREAVRLLMEEGIGRGNSVLDLHLRVIQQAQREIGQLWERNTISIAHEHQATAVSQLALAHLYQQSIRRPAVGKTVLMACVEGELHDMGARICADVLDLHGFDVRFLGANVPTDCLLGFVERTRPDLVALSVTMPIHLPATHAAVDLLRTRTRVPLAIGGRALDLPGARAGWEGVAIFGADALELLRAVRTTLGVPG
ncbi:MAG TPA: cobalamin-dependent protein [Myxococcaceae bacterium]|nr:cobalamin-dependent protein [Myxococcaceae bacterium]